MPGFPKINLAPAAELPLVNMAIACVRCDATWCVLQASTEHLPPQIMLERTLERREACSGEMPWCPACMTADERASGFRWSRGVQPRKDMRTALAEALDEWEELARMRWNDVAGRDWSTFDESEDGKRIAELRAKFLGGKQ